MKTLLSLALVTVSALCFGAPVPEHFENKKFDPAKPPVVDEARPSDKYSAAEWKIASSIKLPPCADKAIWKARGESVIQGIATKEKTAQVKGSFRRFQVLGTQDGTSLKGSGV